MVTDIPTSDLFADDDTSRAGSVPLISSPITPRHTRSVSLVPFSSPTVGPSRLGLNLEEESEGVEEESINGDEREQVEQMKKDEGEQREQTVQDEKREWVKRMRIMFCVREEFEVTKSIIHEDGTLNQDYFRPPKGTQLSNEPVKKWTDKERTLLIQGIQTYGIGHFREISEALLPDWPPNDLRVKSMRLIGRQNLQEYKDWRGSEQDIRDEYERNKEIGMRLGCWKSGVLVFDDAGRVNEEVKKYPVVFKEEVVNGANKKRRR
ncbi:uncharacterized protein SPPG_01670 [Spizellomyces punctatus DAOM BR117]|uniref:Myb-like domain-containing protein n=1 Tax=Spizellomyces punctatus (strain DAOM BR117) TaxID=645134 RepID=A0A0L0HTP8_SPIPD|nr:uncharacterized protein SPPG_01670 [Spizellomyces punctatus DAOM BR117]KND04239.1 hypothetical protein SPPG_01670 [Spizellomyces punctatus DAOM BR117]|eukprot:XP_016612278.1 hypothetical protein SPPG_01670 [Spizellomyces punctatus DAOM BR117]